MAGDKGRTVTELGRAVDALRRHAKFKSIAALASAAGVHHSGISKIISGQSRSLHPGTRSSLEEVFNLPDGTLLQVHNGEITPEQAVALAADEPTDPVERESLAWRVTRLEAELARLAERLDDQAPH